MASDQVRALAERAKELLTHNSNLPGGGGTRVWREKRDTLRAHVSGLPDSAEKTRAERHLDALRTDFQCNTPITWRRHVLALIRIFVATPQFEECRNKVKISIDDIVVAENYVAARARGEKPETYMEKHNRQLKEKKADPQLAQQERRKKEKACKTETTVHDKLQRQSLSLQLLAATPPLPADEQDHASVCSTVCSIAGQQAASSSSTGCSIAGQQAASSSSTGDHQQAQVAEHPTSRSDVQQLAPLSARLCGAIVPQCKVQSVLSFKRARAAEPEETTRKSCKTKSSPSASVLPEEPQQGQKRLRGKQKIPQPSSAVVGETTSAVVKVEEPQEKKPGRKRKLATSQLPVPGAAAITVGDPQGHYAALHVEPGCCFAKIRAAYLRRVLTAHPDKGGSEEAFHRVQEAFDLLSDPDAKEKYDGQAFEAGEDEPAALDAEAAIETTARAVMAQILLAYEEQSKKADMSYIRSLLKCQSTRILEKLESLFALVGGFSASDGDTLEPENEEDVAATANSRSTGSQSTPWVRKKGNGLKQMKNGRWWVQVAWFNFKVSPAKGIADLEQASKIHVILVDIRNAAKKRLSILMDDLKTAGVKCDTQDLGDSYDLMSHDELVRLYNQEPFNSLSFCSDLRSKTYTKDKKRFQPPWTPSLNSAKKFRTIARQVLDKGGNQSVAKRKMASEAANDRTARARVNQEAVEMLKQELDHRKNTALALQASMAPQLALTATAAAEVERLKAEVEQRDQALEQQKQELEIVERIAKQEENDKRLALERSEQESRRAKEEEERALELSRQLDKKKEEVTLAKEEKREAIHKGELEAQRADMLSQQVSDINAQLASAALANVARPQLNSNPFSRYGHRNVSLYSDTKEDSTARMIEEAKKAEARKRADWDRKRAHSDPASANGVRRQVSRHGDL